MGDEYGVPVIVKSVVFDNAILEIIKSAIPFELSIVKVCSIELPILMTPKLTRKNLLLQLKIM